MMDSIGEASSGNSAEPRWSRMVFFSIVLHLVVFSLVFFVPESEPTRRIGGTVYEVNLVELPASGSKRRPVRLGSKAEKAATVSGEAAPAKLIPKPKAPEKPVTIAKKTLKTRKKRPKKSKKLASSLDKALSRIERKVKREEKDPVKQAISRLEARVKGSEEKGAGAVAAPSGIAMRMYEMKVREKIKSNWSYPVALDDPKRIKDLEAVLVVRASKDGGIERTWFKRRSTQIIFDESVMRAVERSDPLPPFPEGYARTHEEIEITFTLKELAGE